MWGLIVQVVLMGLKRLIGMTDDPNKVGKQLEAGKEAQDALANVQQAQHVERDVPLNGPLGDWVRDRAKREANGNG